MRAASVPTAASTTAGSFSCNMAMPEASLLPSASAPASRRGDVFANARHDFVNHVLQGVATPLRPNFAAASAANSPSTPP